MPVHFKRRRQDLEAPSKRRRRKEGRRTQVAEPLGPLRHQWYLPCKIAFDFLLGLLLSFLAAPVIVTAALLVKLTSRGPAFYTQTRVGQHGKLFTIYKIRTMVDKCESLTGPRWALPGDPRITWVGHLLRISHLDELPQLLNVLRGEMSLIGPRPERPEFMPELEHALPGYRRRLALRPGVTGLAQVQLPADTDLTSVRRKLAHDLYYIRCLSPWLDLRILGCTVLYALGVPFRIAGKLFGIPGGAEVEDFMEPVIFEGVSVRMAA